MSSVPSPPGSRIAAAGPDSFAVLATARRAGHLSEVSMDMTLPPPAEAAATDAPDAAALHDAGRPAEEVYKRIGLLTRTLHDSLRELGYDTQLADARENLPDARDRLTYIARVTGEAAEKVLNGVDRARVVQDDLALRANSLRTRWEAVAVFMAKGERATPAGQHLVEETCTFFTSVAGQAETTNGILTDIMMAQDFHDLTGQVIRKVVALAGTLEDQLVRLLLEASPPESRKKIEQQVQAQLEGPVVNYEARADVVADQAGVDDLLASLGF